MNKPTKCPVCNSKKIEFQVMKAMTWMRCKKCEYLVALKGGKKEGDRSKV